MGFVELRFFAGHTGVRVKHDMRESDLVLSVIVDDITYMFALDKSDFEIKKRLDPMGEIYVCITRRDELDTLCSGVVNRKSNVVGAETLKEYFAEIKQVDAVKEVDEVFRSMCIDDGKKGPCAECPYREHFFGSNELKVE